METLKKALQDYFGQALKLTIEIKAVSENDLHTPAVQAVQQRVATQQAAEKAIAEDENVAALKENFDARVVPGSIDPVE
jgi:DNA polymerase-3 subunit gamma/tau